MQLYDDEWARHYTRLADASIAGREGLYRLCKAFLRGLPDEARVLVVGCGTGDDLVTLATALPDARFVAIDPSAPMLARCATRNEEQGLSARIQLHNTTLEHFSAGQTDFDAATAVLVSQHLPTQAAAQAFFEQVAARLKPGGLLYSADLSIATGQDRDAIFELWCSNLLAAGIDGPTSEAMLLKVKNEFRPRDEALVTGFLRHAGFVDILMPFRSLMYGAWAARKGLAPRGT